MRKPHNIFAIPSPRHPHGFTLIELMIVVGIMVALIAILIPSLSKVKKSTTKSTAIAELGAIQAGLRQYYATFNMYPPSGGSAGYLGTVAGRGSAMLAQGLMGYLPYAADGAGPPNAGDSQYGFRTRKSAMGMGGGEVYGPYMPPDPKTLIIGPGDQFFIDPWQHEILYFRSQRPVANAALPPITKIFDLAANNDSFFAADDCSVLSDGTSPGDPTIAPARFYTLFTSGNSNTYTGGVVTGSDSYILISAGPDGIYFTPDDIVVGKN